MKVRMATKEDFVEVHKLLFSIFPNAKAKLKESDKFIIAEEKGELIGFAHFSEDGKKVLLHGFGVMESQRNKGIGSALLDALISYARKRKIFLKTKTNNPAFRLYCRKGFVLKRQKGESVTMIYRHAN